MADGDVSLKYRLLGHDDGASRAFDKVGKSADHLSTRMVAVGTAIGHLAAGGILALGGMAVSAVKSGLTTAASMQQAQIAFKTLLGSSQAAGSYLKYLQDFAAHTPFELKGLVESSRTLLGVGVSAEQAKGILQNFGDAAAAVGIDQEHFQATMIATSQAIGQGRFMTADLNQINNNGIPIWHILGQAMGKSGSQLRDLASHGKLLASDVLPLLEQQMHKDYAGSLEKQSHTLAGEWSNVEDTVNQGLGTAFKGLADWLQQKLPAAIDILAGAFEKLPGIFSAIGTIADRIGDAIGKIVPVVKDKLAPVAKAIIDTAKAWGGKIIDGLSTGIRTGNWGPLGKTIGDGIAAALNSLVIGGGQLVAALQRWVGSIDWLVVGKSVGAQAFPFAVGFVNELLTGVFTAAKNHPMDVALFFVAFIPLGKLASAFGPLRGLIEHLPLGSWFTTMLDHTAAPVWDAFMKLFRFIGTAFVEGWKLVLPSSTQFFDRLWINMSTRIGVMALELFAKAREMIAGLGRGIGSMTAFVVKDALNLIADILRPFATAGSWLIGQGREAIAGLAQGWRGGIGPFIKSVGDIEIKLMHAFGDAGRWLLSAGGDIIRGLIQGIENAAGALWAKVTSIADGIKNKLKDALSIFSPSRVMRDEVGKMIPLGIAEGMQAGSGAIYNVAANLVPTAPTAYGVGTAITAGAGAGGGNHYHLHIPTGFVGSPRELAVAFSEVLQRAKSQGIPLNV